MGPGHSGLKSMAVLRGSEPGTSLTLVCGGAGHTPSPSTLSEKLLD